MGSGSPCEPLADPYSYYTEICRGNCMHLGLLVIDDVTNVFELCLMFIQWFMLLSCFTDVCFTWFIFRLVADYVIH